MTYSLRALSCDPAKLPGLSERLIVSHYGIVRGADTGRLDLAPEATGLYAISIGLSCNFADDHEQLRHGMVMYDALYAWCQRDARA